MATRFPSAFEGAVTRNQSSSPRVWMDSPAWLNALAPPANVAERFVAVADVLFVSSASSASIPTEIPRS